MADTERIIVVDPAAQARQQLVEDMKRLKANPLDVTIPGGYFIVNGKPVDADGNPVKGRSDKSIKAEVAEAVKAEAETAEPVVAETAKKTTKGKGK